MNKQFQIEKSIATRQGKVRIQSFCSPSQIRGYTFDEEFGAHAQYKSLYTKKESLEQDAVKPEANIVLAVTDQNHIIGFAVFVYPEAGERWTELGPGLMMEVKVIEVCRSWRSASIAKELLAMVVMHPRIEAKIAYMVGYSWTWDLDQSRLNAQEYRQVLIKLFEACGFSEFETNEPNICMKHENLFMCRIGQEVAAETIERFNWLRFGITPEVITAPTRLRSADSDSTLTRSLYLPMAEEHLTSLGIYYDWKSQRVALRAAREWENDLDWSVYNEAFSTEDPLISSAIYLGHDATWDLFKRYALDGYLAEVVDHIKKGRHQGIECYYEPKRRIQVTNYLHNSTLGRSHIYRALRSGGISFIDPEKSEWDMISNGLNQSRAMSFKNASAQIPFGGCRVTILSEKVNTGDRQSIGFLAYAIDRMRAFVGPDMGFPPELIDFMKREGYSQNVTGGLDSKVGPPGPPTAFGLYLALKEAAYARFGSLNLSGKKIVVQGIGAVGFPLVDRYLIKEEAELYVAETAQGPIEKLKAKYPGQFKVLLPHEVTSFHGDFWIPCATGGVIEESTIDQLHYAVIIGAANNSLKAESQEEEIKLARLLGERGILFQIDWLHNTAGIIGGAEEYLHQDKADYQQVLNQVEKVCRDGVRQNLKAAFSNKITPTEQGYRHFNSMIYK